MKIQIRKLEFVFSGNSSSLSDGAKNDIVAVLQTRVPLRQWHPTCSDPQAVISLVFVQSDLMSNGLLGRSALRGSNSSV